MLERKSGGRPGLGIRVHEMNAIEKRIEAKSTIEIIRDGKNEKRIEAVSDSIFPLNSPFQARNSK